MGPTQQTHDSEPMSSQQYTHVTRLLPSLPRSLAQKKIPTTNWRRARVNAATSHTRRSAPPRTPLCSRVRPPPRRLHPPLSSAHPRAAAAVLGQTLARVMFPCVATAWKLVDQLGLLTLRPSLPGYEAAALSGERSNPRPHRGRTGGASPSSRRGKALAAATLPVFASKASCSSP